MKENVLNRITKETFDFLWFSYFGITAKAAEDMNEDKRIMLCAQRAYLDMNRTLRFTEDNNNESKEKNNSEKERENFRNTICGIIADNIKRHILKSDEDSYDDIHKKVCTFIIEKVNSYKDDFMADNFTYGQAQKWLNMTIKYMYLMGFWKDEFKNIEKALHIPVDSYIIQAVWEKECVEIPLLEDKLPKKGTRGAYSYEKVKRWSKWEYDEYQEFQDSLKKYIDATKQHKTPLEWEAEAWIEVAERNKK
ncbi:MAG: hypothetical protein IJZ51_08890 [Ruminiclostridium sp.]|nr:hypothetical protein [Ruminiclostridium sp.]